MVVPAGCLRASERLRSVTTTRRHRRPAGKPGAAVRRAVAQRYGPGPVGPPPGHSPSDGGPRGDRRHSSCAGCVPVWTGAPTETSVQTRRASPTTMAAGQAICPRRWTGRPSHIVVGILVVARHASDTYRCSRDIRARQPVRLSDCRSGWTLADRSRRTFQVGLRLPKRASVLMKSRPCRVWRCTGPQVPDRRSMRRLPRRRCREHGICDHA